ncbi:MAG TPA: hypothetical protein VHE35_28105, partial [Kofleriaceae bacterium]|nr:hypothetical protein [Kofleriaceae bacterium]
MSARAAAGALSLLRSLSLACACACAGAGLVAACGPDPTVIAPVVETPAAGAPGAAFPDLDELELSLARVGATDDLITDTFHRGDTVELTDVPDGDALILHLTGRLGGADTAYGRTCPFAIHTAELPASLRVYFAQIVHWAARDTPPDPVRIAGAAVTYHDDRLIFLGGVDAAGAPVTDLDVFDPATGTFTDDGRLAPRLGGAAATLGIGGADGVIVLGGIDPAIGAASPALERIELDATADRRVETVDRPLLARVGAAVCSLTDGRVFVAGGQAVGGPPLAGTAEVTSVGTTVREYAATLAVPRVGATATLLSDDLGAPVLIAGGRDVDGQPVALAELWKPLAETLADPAVFHPTMIVPRYGHAAARMPDGTVLVIGGVDGQGHPVRELERFSLDAGFALARTSTGAPALLPAGVGVLDRAVTALPDGRLLVTGGREADGGPPLATAALVSLDTLDGSVDILATSPLLTPRAG